MYKTKLLTMSAALISMLILSGCGSSSSRVDDSTNIRTKEMKEPIMPTPTKLDRANWDNVDHAYENLVTTVQNGYLAIKIRDEHIEGHHYRTEQVFISSDGLATTGYNFHRGAAHISGAEYLIEGNNLYSYTGNGHSWSWHFISRVHTRVIDGNQLEVEFPINLIETVDSINFFALLRDNNWQLESPIYRWSQAGNGEFHHFVGGVNNGFSALRDGNNLSFTIESNMINDPNFATQDILIDADNNSQTGYSTAIYNYIGAEYLIEGNRLYRHRGGGWRWQYVGRVNRTRNGQTIRITINATDQHIADTIRSTATLIGRNWRAIQRFGLHTFNLGNGNIQQRTLEDYGRMLQNILQNSEPLMFSPNHHYLLVSSTFNAFEGNSYVNYYIFDISTGTPYRLRRLEDYSIDPYYDEYMHANEDKVVINNFHFINNSTIEYIYYNETQNIRERVTYDFINNIIQRERIPNNHTSTNSILS